jgi:hypothetical protein
MQYILPFRMATNLRLRERAEWYDLDAIAPRIIDRLAHQPLAHLAAAQSSGHFRMVDYDQTVAGPAVGHFRLDAIDD